MAIKKKTTTTKKKAVVEKKTGEKYTSKAAMLKHEKSEPKKVKMAEGEMKKGGKVKKYQAGGKSYKTLYKGQQYDKNGKLIDKYNVASKTGDRSVYTVYQDGNPVRYTYNPSKQQTSRTEMDTTGYAKGKKEFNITTTTTKGKGKPVVTKGKVARKNVPAKLKQMQTMKMGGKKKC
jgi:hypothetical protein